MFKVRVCNFADNIKKHYNKVVVVTIVLLGFFFHKNYMNEFPQYKHAWAQSDRYSLAQGFVNNNLNFFKPETFTYNNEFPHTWKKPTDKTITSVDFPIHDYIVAVFMKITNNKSPWLFRLYTLLYSFVFLFFVFKLSYTLTENNFIKSLFVVIFAATSPVFVYYQAGFLPSIPSLANAFIAIYFYTKYLINNKNKYFNISMLFLTLATLNRTTFAIVLVAVLGHEFLRFVLKKTNLKQKIIPVLLSASAILFFFFYNDFLRDKYGSLFLNYLLPAKSVKEFLEITKIVIDRWYAVYFSKFHYVLLAVLLIALVFVIVYKKVKIQKINLSIFTLISILFVGCMAFYTLMTKQYLYHDYYFLDTLFLPTILLLIFVISALPFSILAKSKYLQKIGVFISYITPISKSKMPEKNKYLRMLGVFIIFVILIVNAKISLKDGRITGYWDKTKVTIDNFENAEKYMDTLGIDKDAKILAIDTHAPNIPFLLMNRKGYTIMTPNKENLEQALKWDFDYIVTQNDFFFKTYSAYPEIIFNTKILWSNGKISISKLIPTDTLQTLNKYLGLDKKTIVKKEIMNCDTTINTNWSNVKLTDEYKFLETKSNVVVSKDMEYGLTYKTKKISGLKQKSRLLIIQSYFLCNSDDDFKIIVSINENDKNTYFRAYDLQNFIHKKNEWEKVNISCQLPKVTSNNYEFSIYIWNINRSELFLNNFGFVLY